MSYNLTNISQNMTGILSLTQQVNEKLMFGWFGTIFLIGIAAVLLTSFLFSTNDVKRSVAATSFLTFGIALFLRAISLVPDTAIYVTLICCAASLAFAWRRD